MDLNKKAEIIADYIKDSRYTQAVLINGAWGVGKTHFVDKILLKELKDYIVIRYSLYGVQSAEQVISELRKEMLIKLIENKEFEIKGKNIKVPSKLLDVAPNAINILWKKFGLEVDDLSELTDKIDFDKSKIVIIFDDLERTEMEINEVLGVINSYVECQKIKVIIIANENEIGSSRVSTNLPLKFSVASNPHISLEETNSVDNRNKEDKNANKNYTYKELIERTKALFANDIIFNSIKEKLIGLTITINADFRQLYNQIIENYAIESKDFLLKNKDYMIEILQAMECQNLRTFIFAVITFDKIYEVIKVLGNEKSKPEYKEVFDNELIQIMRSIMYVSINYKNGKSICTTNTVFSSSSYSIYVRNIKEYSFVNRYICFHELNEAEIIKDFDLYILNEISRQEKEDEKNNLSYFKINSFGWLDYYDDEVIELSNQLYIELSEEKYDVSYFKGIVVYLIHLDFHFKDKKSALLHSDDEYLSLMENYIRNHSIQKNQIELFDIFSDDKDFNQKYNSYVSSLIIATKERENIDATNGVKLLFTSENWAEDFYQYCREKRDEFISSHSFLSSFDINVISQSLLEANNLEIRRFLQAICSIYDFSNIRDFFQTDAANLESIIDILKKKYSDEKTNCTTKVVMDLYIKKLEGKLLSLKG